ncbi:hypothetical protein AZI86_05145 [Bdellovibrio bacteriovorus]|uniref:Uncharacterized protein n=1 Tax=Bdellovibrio bacteriovorus TaxID=959 RepID=A0A150WQF5_BDEBC|nr:hypothetical protein [Bdellovibrio bacteriovorus]KYG66435.1 hypothetical protein AZI86_05145 [Bdellovibrio bacteriovorus]
MKENIRELSLRLRNVHQRFLELERRQAEQDLERRLTSFDFLLYLTQDYRYAWLQPLSALIAEMDAFVDETEVVSAEDFERLHLQIRNLLGKKGTRLAGRFTEHLEKDPELVLAYGSLNEFINANRKPEAEL